MPGYTFRCRKCGGLTEVVHGFSEPHPTTCERVTAGHLPNVQPELCGGALVRVFDPPNMVYRGSGFYATDRHLTPVKPEDYNPDED